MRKQKRNNAVYTGQSKRGAVVERGDRGFVFSFYLKLNDRLLSKDEIEIIPPEQVNPTHDSQDQAYIVADYCVRKILPEVTSLFHGVDKVTSRLRTLAPIVDVEAAEAAENAAYAVYVGYYGVDDVAYAARNVAARAARFTATFAKSEVAENAADVVYNSLVRVIQAGNEAAYNRIIDLTNEMLESL